MNDRDGGLGAGMGGHVHTFAQTPQNNSKSEVTNKTASSDETLEKQN